MQKEYFIVFLFNIIPFLIYITHIRYNTKATIPYTFSLFSLTSCLLYKQLAFWFHDLVFICLHRRQLLLRRPRLTLSTHPDYIHPSGCHSTFAIINHYFCIPNWIPPSNKSCCLYLKEWRERAPNPTCSLIAHKRVPFSTPFINYMWGYFIEK